MNYPKTSAFVEFVVEDTETYYKRCIDRIANCKEVKYTSLNQIVEATGINFSSIYLIRNTYMVCVGYEI